eukprot:CAMPEP_0182600254 /NCGR_PEP_ID=MMETSP1324-20130603/90892_1 /TAXON_ID=236786 /ORGANISM="Florenciella sp., Strain RCC1587" /LENGTH=298 /DNA_ID=CAMNT_0024818163 /DNA_START=67 /DNA_END=963 /DNA_ORIENTATION=+
MNAKERRKAERAAKQEAYEVSKTTAAATSKIGSKTTAADAVGEVAVAAPVAAPASHGGGGAGSSGGGGGSSTGGDGSTGGGPEASAALEVANAATASSGSLFDGVPSDAPLPKLIVFDLDATLWEPELYQLRHLEGYQKCGKPGPVANTDVSLTEGGRAVLEALATDERFVASGCKLAVASRNTKGPWAEQLLKDFEIQSKSLDERIMFKEIYQGEKTKHFSELKTKSGIEYNDMIFFDDALNGKFGNCEKVAALGVLSCHTPDGLTVELFKLTLNTYAKLRAEGGDLAQVVKLRDSE